MSGSSRVIPLHPATPSVRGLPPAPVLHNTAQPLLDQLHRPLQDLRISVTDRCNFRCTYCMPRHVYGPGHRFMAQSALLSFEEIERISRLMLPLGVKKLRLTGGEPLMRKQLDRLIAALAALPTPHGDPVDLAMTTNASLLAQHATALKQAGLQRLTISLDALDDAIFQRMNDAQVNVAQVLGGIEAAQKAGFERIKVNMVVQRGVNEGQIVPMARHFRHSGIELRFIEFMDVGTTNGWQSSDVFSAQAIQAQLQAHFPLHALPPRHVSDTAMRYAYADGAGTVGFIASVTQAFCGHCNRLRLSTDGQLFTCLFATQGTDLKEALRSGMPDTELQARLATLWSSRQDRYSELREQHRATAGTPTAQARVEMSYIGG
jgi:GTP 3',8-cyclase